MATIDVPQLGTKVSIPDWWVLETMVDGQKLEFLVPEKEVKRVMSAISREEPKIVWWPFGKNSVTSLDVSRAVYIHLIPPVKHGTGTTPWAR